MAFKKNPLAENKTCIAFIYVVMAILWFSWFQMCFFDPVKIEVSVWIRSAGLLLFSAGIFLFIFSHIHLRGFQDRGELKTTGIYSKIRNPMYLGFILWIIGFPIFTRSLITLGSSPVWISNIIFWKILEEKELEKKYREYREYKKKTWF
jgi:protein-S-isoprenylcysteine O-methyltransferase Ste14